MIFSENIYFLILFTLPAALNILFNAHIRNTPISKEDKSVEIAECIAFCFAVFLLNIIVLQKETNLFAQYSLLNPEAQEVFSKQMNFSYIGFMIKYFVCNIITSFVVLISWYTMGQWIFRSIRNGINYIRKSPRELKFSDVWSNVFETKQYANMSDCIIRIERGGNLVTAGVVCIYSSPNSPKKDFLLRDTDLIRQIFEDDEKLPLELKMFKQADCEYYDTQNDLLIKFYNTECYRRIYGE